MKRIMIISVVVLWCSIGYGLTFTDYGSGTTVELTSGAGVWQVNWGQGPWTWFDPIGASILDSTVTGVFDVHTTAPADISADLVATLPIEGTLTLSSHDPGDPGTVTGTMVLSGSGQTVIDINASRVFVDEEGGMFMAPIKPLDSKSALTLQEATGIFADIEQIDDWDLYVAGWYAAPLIEGLALQDNIFAALGGQVPLIGGLAEFALTGEYIPEPATVTLLGLGGLALLRRRRLRTGPN